MNAQHTPLARERTLIGGPSIETPLQQVAHHQEQAELCAAHAAHYAEQAKAHADYVGQLISYHGLAAPPLAPRAYANVPAHVQAVEAPGVHVLAADQRAAQHSAPPGFHTAPSVDVSGSAATIRLDAQAVSALLGSGGFAPTSTPAQAGPAQHQALGATPAVDAQLQVRAASAESAPTAFTSQAHAAPQSLAASQSPAAHQSLAASQSPAAHQSLAAHQSPDAHQSLAAHQSPDAHQASAAPPSLAAHQSPAAHQAPAASDEPAKASVKRALAASGVGVLLGAVLWGGVGFLTGGWEFKYGAIVIGFIVGALALKGAGASSKVVGIAAGAMSLVSLLLGKALFELLVHPEFSMADHIGYHTTVIDLIFYVATVGTGFVVASTEGALDKVKRRLGRHVPALR